MRKYDVAYVPNGPVNYYPAVPLQEMTLEEIRKKYIKTCAKANGSVAACSKCLTPCAEGRRAVQLVANSIYDDPPIPLYGGKTLIERAREENMKRREEKEANTENKEKKEKRAYNKIENWYEDSLASGDQVKWLMEKMNISKTQAKKKIYSYRYNHGLTGETHEISKPVVEKASDVIADIKQQIESQPIVETKPINENIEAKLEYLIKLQEEKKKEMDKYTSLYALAKKEYDAIKEKADVLCSAMDILNE